MEAVLPEEFAHTAAGAAIVALGDALTVTIFVPLAEHEPLPVMATLIVSVPAGPGV